MAFRFPSASLRLALALASLISAGAAVAAAADTSRLGVGASFDTLQVGPTTYQRVQVRSVNPRTIMISHAGGLASVPLRSLSPELQAAFGYDAASETAAALAPPEPARATATAPKPVRKAPPPPAPSSFDVLLQSFGQPPDLHPSVDLRPKFSDLALNVKNQGPRPSCAVFAVVSALEYQNAQLTSRAERFSEEYLVWATFKSLNRPPRVRAEAETENPDSLDSVDEGFALSEVVTALRTYGIPHLDSLPYSFAKSPAVDPPREVIDEARSRQRVAVFALPGRDRATQLANLVHALNASVPVAIGLRWPMARSLRTGYISGQTPREGNGHAVTVVGYENKTGVLKDTVFIFKNSWGVRWGASGYGYVTYAYLNANLLDTALLEIAPAAARTRG